jgi:hypothetical protein
MTWWELAAWGAFGGLSVEAIEFYGVIKSHKRWPWQLSGEPGAGPLAVSVFIRIGLGLGLAWAAGDTGQVPGPLGAIAVGVAAPLLVEQMTKRTRLDFNPASVNGSTVGHSRDLPTLQLGESHLKSEPSRTGADAESGS